MVKQLARLQRHSKERLEALRFWHKKTGIPINTIVEQGLELRIRELELVYNDKFKPE